jgi:hypothetical protein
MTSSALLTRRSNQHKLTHRAALDMPIYCLFVFYCIKLLYSISVQSIVYIKQFSLVYSLKSFNLCV